MAAHRRPTCARVLRARLDRALSAALCGALAASLLTAVGVW